MTVSSALLNGALPSTAPARPSVFQRAFSAVIESQQRRARRHVNSILLEMDDSTLAACGLSRADLVKGGTIYRTW